MVMFQNFGFERPRLVVKEISPDFQRHGAGAVVRRSIGGDELKSLDPFLLLDEFEVSPPAGFPDHGHRGFQTATYMLQGGLSHQDFAGNKGTVIVGDVQWMSAGRGIVHSEMPVGDVTRGLQLWINLPSKDKMTEPRYEEVMSSKIPIAEKDGVEVKVIAGESMGYEYPTFTQTPMTYLFISLKPEAQYHQTITKAWNAFVYIIEGEGIFGISDSKPTEAHHLLVLSNDGDGLSVWNKSEVKPLKFILVSGQPLDEPVVHQGPFVMNTQDEVNQTIRDYKEAKNGFENAKQWKSKW